MGVRRLAGRNSAVTRAKTPRVRETTAVQLARVTAGGWACATARSAAPDVSGMEASSVRIRSGAGGPSPSGQTPPDALTISPVSHLASLEARNTATVAMSST